MKNVSDMQTEGAGREVVQTARQSAQQVKSTVSQEAGKAVENIKATALEQVERGKNELAGSLKSVEQALHKTSGDMENSALAPQVEKVAEALHTAHQFIETHGIEDIGTALRRLSLQHPVVFYSGIFAVGFAAGRFLSATQERADLDINLLDQDLAMDQQRLPGPTVSHHGPY